MDFKYLKKPAENFVFDHYAPFFIIMVCYLAIYETGRYVHGLSLMNIFTVGSLALVCRDISSLRLYDSYIPSGRILPDMWHDLNCYGNGILFITLLRMMWIFLWSCLLIVPGIIKALAYSQALFIYKDTVDDGRKIRFRDAITKSRKLMNGHKLELFWLHLSFFWWYCLEIFTFGVAAIWVLPYKWLTLANFYNDLECKQHPKIING